MKDGFSSLASLGDLSSYTSSELQALLPLWEMREMDRDDMHTIIRLWGNVR